MCEYKLKLEGEIDDQMAQKLGEQFAEIERCVAQKMHAPKHVELHFKTRGGALGATSRIVEMMDELRNKTNLKIHGIIDKKGICASAATLLFGNCDYWKMNKSKTIMIHAPKMQLKELNGIDVQKMDKELKKNGSETWLSLSFLESCAKEVNDLKDESDKMYAALKKYYNIRDELLQPIFEHNKDHDFPYESVKTMHRGVELS